MFFRFSTVFSPNAFGASVSIDYTSRRIFADSHGRWVKFHLDLSEHAGFQLDED